MSGNESLRTRRATITRNCVDNCNHSIISIILSDKCYFFPPEAVAPSSEAVNLETWSPFREILEPLLLARMPPCLQELHEIGHEETPSSKQIFKKLILKLYISLS